ncbi:MAG TPA: hypothetical protein VL098_04615 [Flavipsychrobacter sp.]|nr:hypothetical protein [Flavipsychrobacter sp.]
MNKKLHTLGILLAGLSFIPASAQETIKHVETSSSSAQSAASAGAYSGQNRAIARGASYDVLDTNYVPASRMKQHRKFLNSEYMYPAKPRNMWEIGFGAGLFNYTADVPSLLLWQGGGYAFHAHVRKAWGYTFSTRLQYNYGIAKGLQWQPAGNYRYNPAWTSHGYVAAIEDNEGNVSQPEQYVNYNYRSEAHQLNVDFMLNSNNIRFHKAQTGLSFYGFVGLGGFAFRTHVNALDANNERYDFAAITEGIDAYKHKNFRKVQRRLQSAMDNTYETDAETERTRRRPVLGRSSIDFCYSAGLGLQIKVSKHVNIAIEDRITIPHEEDLLDGQRWAEQTWGDPVFSQNNDMVNYLSLGLNINIGGAKRNVEPLYWLNPLDYLYNSSNQVLADADADGVTDQFDQCPGTPEGIPVDVNGCPLDTDGDGVPDYRDKQLITPTECQPVDEDGIGKCPCPDCMVGAAPCSNILPGSIVFEPNSARIKSGAQAQLSTLATSMKANPNCKVVIIGSGNGSKVQEQRSWDRVEAAITYLSERYGIDRNRFIFQYGQPGDANSISYRPAMEGEDGLSNVPPPFPNLRRD